MDGEVSLLIYMKVKGNRVEARVKSGRRKKTYVFPFSTLRDQATRISLLVGSLPIEFYIDAFFEQLKSRGN